MITKLDIDSTDEYTPAPVNIPLTAEAQYYVDLYSVDTQTIEKVTESALNTCGSSSSGDPAPTEAAPYTEEQVPSEWPSGYYF